MRSTLENICFPEHAVTLSTQRHAIWSLWGGGGGGGGGVDKTERTHTYYIHVVWNDGLL